MKISEIYAAIAKGDLLDKDTGYLTMIAIELLARVEGVPVAALDLAAPRFALSYPFDKRDLRGNWHGATHFQAWRRLILDAQMLSAPGDVDGAPWSSLARSERLGFNSSGGTFYDLPKYLPETILPTDVTDAVITATYEMLDAEKRPRFRAGVNAFRRLFGNDLVQRTGLLPPKKPMPIPTPRDHHLFTEMSPDILQWRSSIKTRAAVNALDHVNRLAVSAGCLNGQDDTLADLRRALVTLSPPESVNIPPASAAKIRSHVNQVVRSLGGPDPRKSAAEQAWSDLRAAAREAGCDTSSLWAIGKPAAARNLFPRQMSPAHARDIIRSYRLNSMPTVCRRACEQFDAARGKVPPDLLPPEPLGIRHVPRKSPRDAISSGKKAVTASDIAKAGWRDLYSTFRNKGWSTDKISATFSFLKAKCIRAGYSPQDLTPEIISRFEQGVSKTEFSRLRAPIRHLRNLGVEDPAYAQVFRPLPPLEWGRSHGGVPASCAQELEALLDFMNAATPTRRSFRVSVGVLADALGRPNISLEELLATDMTALDLGAHEPRRKTHLGKIKSLRAFTELPWTPAWRQLQGEVSASGITANLNPVPKVLSWSPRTDPCGLNLAWAQRLDRQFRSTLRNPPHGRADIARTLARHLSAFDMLHEIPRVVAAGLLPPKIGPIR